MAKFICVTCGTQYPPSDAPPDSCPICLDERQFLPPGGQAWTTLEKMRVNYFNAWRMHEPELYGIGTVPNFAIAQRALLLRTPAGNVLWDCISFVDDATVDLIQAMGGVKAIAISHPHYYSSMVEWAHALECPVWLHEGDRGEVKRPDPALHFWSGSTKTLLGDLTLINAPGHFDGATMLHWPDGAEGRGALLAGDIVQVSADRATAGFMRSYPNWIPLGPNGVRRIADAVAPYAYERVYGAWWDRCIMADGKAAVERSVTRALKWLAD
jgi:glyoxylase-like metal-dependent hydrolase (beta-lactamase superfamily II)